jgi:hypothetical protein
MEGSFRPASTPYSLIINAASESIGYEEFHEQLHGRANGCRFQSSLACPPDQVVHRSRVALMNWAAPQQLCTGERGWMSENMMRLKLVGESFLLTSLFIEPMGRRFECDSASQTKFHISNNALEDARRSTHSPTCPHQNKFTPSLPEFPYSWTSGYPQCLCNDQRHGQGGAERTMR